jgi:hypothetical protein
MFSSNGYAYGEILIEKVCAKHELDQARKSYNVNYKYTSASR